MLFTVNDLSILFCPWPQFTIFQDKKTKLIIIKWYNFPFNWCKRERMKPPDVNYFYPNRSWWVELKCTGQCELGILNKLGWCRKLWRVKNGFVCVWMKRKGVEYEKGVFGNTKPLSSGKGFVTSQEPWEFVAHISLSHSHNITFNVYNSDTLSVILYYFIMSLPRIHKLVCSI